MIEAIDDNPSVLIQVVQAFDMTKYWDMYPLKNVFEGFREIRDFGPKNIKFSYFCGVEFLQKLFFRMIHSEEFFIYLYTFEINLHNFFFIISVLK